MACRPGARRTASDIVAAPLSRAKVVKAFNQLPAALLARQPTPEGGRCVVFVAGNGDSANVTVEALAEQLGHSPILVGRIDGGGRLIPIPGSFVLHNFVEYPFK